MQVGDAHAPEAEVFGPEKGSHKTHDAKVCSGCNNALGRGWKRGLAIAWQHCAKVTRRMCDARHTLDLIARSITKEGSRRCVRRGVSIPTKAGACRSHDKVGDADQTPTVQRCTRCAVKAEWSAVR